MQIRDRIKELRRVEARTLRPNPRNWRTHPKNQADALRGVLSEIGFAQALVARELEDGSLELIDGHLRAETTPNAIVPVLVVDVDEREAAALLATLDPLAALAMTDEDQLAALLADVQTDNESLQKVWDELLADAGDTENIAPPGGSSAEAEEVKIPALWQVLVECTNEEQQREVFERLTGEGMKCRLVNL
jgi:ParB-like chromosome segregation protein Spo0J